MWLAIKQSLILILALGVILGGIYPLSVTWISKVIFPNESSGNFLYKDAKVVGSKLIGQKFTTAKYFHGRSSYAGDGYNPLYSGGSNFGPTSKKLAISIAQRAEHFLKENPGVKKGEIPIDMLTVSGSGLDPHISPLAALTQVERVAKARAVDPKLIQKLVNEETKEKELYFLGERKINVLELNIKLDEEYPVR